MMYYFFLKTVFCISIVVVIFSIVMLIKPSPGNTIQPIAGGEEIYRVSE